MKEDKKMDDYMEICGDLQEQLESGEISASDYHARMEEEAYLYNLRREPGTFHVFY